MNQQELAILSNYYHPISNPHSKRIRIWDLYLSPDRFIVAHYAESLLIDLVINSIHVVCVEHLEGYHKEYDVAVVLKRDRLNPKAKKILLEIKMSHNSGLFVETATYDGTPSGLTTSQALFYLCQNIQNNKAGDRKNGKVRLISTRYLREWIKDIKDNKLEYFLPENDSPGAQGAYFYFFNQPDFWLGDLTVSGVGEMAIVDFSELKYSGHTNRPIEFIKRLTSETF